MIKLSSKERKNYQNQALVRAPSTCEFLYISGPKAGILNLCDGRSSPLGIGFSFHFYEGIFIPSSLLSQFLAQLIRSLLQSQFVGCTLASQNKLKNEVYRPCLAWGILLELTVPSQLWKVCWVKLIILNSRKENGK